MITIFSVLQQIHTDVEINTMNNYKKHKQIQGSIQPVGRPHGLEPVRTSPSQSRGKCTKWLQQRLGKRLSTYTRFTVRNANHHQLPNLKVLIYQNITIISKTSKEGNFPAIDACLSTGKANRDLKERELIFIMLLSLPL